MKKICLLLISMLFSLPVFAEMNLEPLLNKVSLQLRAEQQVTTKTALVNVGINAAVADKNIEKVQNEVMQKLNQLSNKGEWRILSFNRQQDRSGLESIQIIAEARLPQTDLSNLRDKAKEISRPGQTLTIENVQFTPSEEEVRIANIDLRNNLYLQAKAEIEALNKLYPEQKYYLHRIEFISPITPRPMAAPMAMLATARVEAPAPAPLAVGNKQFLEAAVVLASMPQQVTQQLTTH